MIIKVIKTVDFEIMNVYCKKIIYYTSIPSSVFLIPLGKVKKNFLPTSYYNFVLYITTFLLYIK